MDGVPIALGDLKTIIAIERELQRIQETYFSGRTFEGEALDNLNSLMAQLQTQGLTLASQAAADQVVLDTGTFTTVSSGYDFPINYISGVADLEAGDTLKVRFKLAIPDTIQALSSSTKIVVGFSNNPTDLDAYLASESITIEAAIADPDAEYTLTYTVPTDWTAASSNLYLTVSYEMRDIENPYSFLTANSNLPYGDIYGGVSFYEPEGFLFQEDGVRKENWNCLFNVTITHPELFNSWTKTGPVEAPTGLGDGTNTYGHFYISNTSQSDGYSDLNYILRYLNQCVGDTDTNKDHALRFRIETTITHSNSQSQALNCTFDEFVEFYNSVSRKLTVNSNAGSTGFPLALAFERSQTISFTAFHETLPDFFYIPYMADASSGQTYEQVTNVETTTSNTTVTLVDPQTGNESKPNLTITAPAGEYKSGDLVPITITGDEYIKVERRCHRDHQ